MSTRSWRLLCALVATVAPSALVADGMVFRTPLAGAARTVEAGPQRGLVWRQHDALEVWIEPVYAWQGDDVGAWVIPLPALPEVLEGDPKVLDDLDALTAPTFLSVCWEPGCHEECNLFGCFTGGGSSGSDASRTGQADARGSSVTVWASGTVGTLAYDVISAVEGADVRAWLDTNGYAAGDGANEALATLDAEGLFFFVARVAAPREPGLSLAPVRFRFAADTEPFYPVRLTAATLAADTDLDVTLWVLADQRLLPSGEPHVFADTLAPSGVPTPEAYQAAVNDSLNGMPQGGVRDRVCGSPDRGPRLRVRLGTADRLRL